MSAQMYLQVFSCASACVRVCIFADNMCIPIELVVSVLGSLQHSQSIINTDSRGRTMRGNKQENKYKYKKKII